MHSRLARPPLWPAFLFFLLWTTVSAADVIYVNSAAAPGGDGLSWAGAFNDLHDALDLAATAPNGPHEVWIAAGTYKPDRGTGDRSQYFDARDGVSIYGGFQGSENTRDDRNPTLNVTTLSGDLNGDDGSDFENYADNSRRVLIAISQGLAVLDGVTVRGGNSTSGVSALFLSTGSPIIADCRIKENLAATNAVYVLGAGSPRFVRCEFSRNRGIAVVVGPAPRCTFANCRFVDNAPWGALRVWNGADFQGCLWQRNRGVLGGAIDASAAPLTMRMHLIGCRFEGNIADDGQYASSGSGGAIALSISTSAAADEPLCRVEDCSFSGNRAAKRAGAIQVTLPATPVPAVLIRDCEFTGNSAGEYGGAIGLFGTYDSENLMAAPAVQDSRFTENTAGTEGGGVSASRCRPVIARCEFIANQAIYAGGVGAVHGLDADGCRFERNGLPKPIGSVGGGLMIGGYSAQPPMRSVVKSCVFRFNTGIDGSALLDYGPTTIISCSFTANTAYRFSGPYILSAQTAALTTSCLSTVANCAFVGNRSEDYAPALRFQDETCQDGDLARVVNCLFYSNESVDTAAVWGVPYAPPAFRNCVFWANRNYQGISESSQLMYVTDIQHSLVDGWTGDLGGVGNSGADPLFRDPLGSDGLAGTGDENLRLRPRSPAIDAGDSTALPPDVADLDGDGDMAEPLPLDLDGQPRVARKGLDIGAYEFPGGPIMNRP